MTEIPFDPNPDPEILLEAIQREIGDDKSKDNLKTHLKTQMESYGGFSGFVEQKMSEALTPQEAELIGLTALTTFRYSQSIPTSEEIAGLYTAGVTPNYETMIMVIEDDIMEHKDNHNYTFIRIQEEMKDHPKLSLFLVNQMRKSVSLEEASLIGDTSLIIFETMKATPKPVQNK